MKKTFLFLVLPFIFCFSISGCALITYPQPTLPVFNTNTPSFSTQIITITPISSNSGIVSPTCTSTQTTHITTITPNQIFKIPSLTSTSSSTITPIPSVQNDLKYLAFSQLAIISVGSMDSECYGIGVLHSNGSQLKIIENKNLSFSLTWSPDGQWIAYDNIVNPLNSISDIFLIQPNGTNKKQLTYANLLIKGIDWSPDGQKLVLFDTKPNLDVQIVEVSRDGKNYQIINSPENYKSNPAWSPDGLKIAYLSNGDFSTVSPSFLNIFDLNTGLVQKINDVLAFNGKISWSPDDKNIAFISYDREDCGTVQLVNLLGNNYQSISGKDLCARSPTWSPDGRYVAFLGSAGFYNAAPYHWEIFLYDLENRTLSQLSKQNLLSSCDVTFLSWSPVPGLRIGQTYTITPEGNNLLLLTLPSLKGTQLEDLKTGERVTVLEDPILAEGFYWRKVRAGDGKEGYVKEVRGWFLPVE